MPAATPAPAHTAGTSGGDHVRALVEALGLLSAPGLDAGLRAAAGQLPLEHVIQLVVIPFLREVGDRWEQGRIGVAHEHLASEVVARWLDALIVTAPVGDGPSAVLACPPHERHDLVLRSFALLLQRDGWRVTHLGADVPTSALALVCRQVRPDLVVLAASRPSVLEARAGALRRVAGGHRTALGGQGATPAVAQVLGAHLLPPDPVAAVAVARRLAEGPVGAAG